MGDAVRKGDCCSCFYFSKLDTFSRWCRCLCSFSRFAVKRSVSCFSNEVWILNLSISDWMSLLSRILFIMPLLFPVWVFPANDPRSSMTFWAINSSMINLVILVINYIVWMNIALATPWNCTKSTCPSKLDPGRQSYPVPLVGSHQCGRHGPFQV